MADDIDDLLDEVESKYVNKKIKPAERVTNQQTKQTDNVISNRKPPK